MNRQVAVLGLGRFGSSVVEALVKHRVDVLAIDHNPENVQSISEIATYAVQCDATDVKALRAVNTQDVDAAVVSMGQDVEATILIVMILKDLGIKDIIAKAFTPLHGKILTNLGVKEVIYPERDAAVRLSRRLATPRVLQYLEVSSGYFIEEVKVPRTMVGKRLGESNLRNQYKVNVIAIKHWVQKTVKGQAVMELDFNFMPSPEDRLGEGDVIVVLGKPADLEWLAAFE